MAHLIINEANEKALIEISKPFISADTKKEGNILMIVALLIIAFAFRIITLEKANILGMELSTEKLLWPFFMLLLGGVCAYMTLHFYLNASSEKYVFHNSINFKKSIEAALKTKSDFDVIANEIIDMLTKKSGNFENYEHSKTNDDIKKLNKLNVELKKWAALFKKINRKRKIREQIELFFPTGLGVIAILINVLFVISSFT